MGEGLCSVPRIFALWRSIAKRPFKQRQSTSVKRADAIACSEFLQSMYTNQTTVLTSDGCCSNRLIMTSSLYTVHAKMLAFQALNMFRLLGLRHLVGPKGALCCYYHLCDVPFCTGLYPCGGWPVVNGPLYGVDQVQKYPFNKGPHPYYVGWVLGVRLL